MKLNSLAVTWAQAKLTSEFFERVKQMNRVTQKQTELHPSVRCRKLALKATLNHVCEQKYFEYKKTEAVRKATQDAFVYSELRDTVLYLYATVREFQEERLCDEAKLAAAKKSLQRYIDNNTTME